MSKGFVITTAILSCILLILLAGWCVSDSKGTQLTVEAETLSSNLSQLNYTIQTKQQENASLQQTVSDLSGDKNQLQSEITSLQSQLAIEKNKNAELSQQLGNSQEALSSYQARVSGTYDEMVKDYNNYLISRSGGPTTINLPTGEIIPSTNPVLTAADRASLSVWYGDLEKFNDLVTN